MDGNEVRFDAPNARWPSAALRRSASREHRSGVRLARRPRWKVVAGPRIGIGHIQALPDVGCKLWIAEQKGSGGRHNCYEPETLKCAVRNRQTAIGDAAGCGRRSAALHNSRRVTLGTCPYSLSICRRSNMDRHRKQRTDPRRWGALSQLRSEEHTSSLT